MQTCKALMRRGVHPSRWPEPGSDGFGINRYGGTQQKREWGFVEIKNEGVLVYSSINS